MVICWIVGYFSLRSVIDDLAFHASQLLFSRIALLICIFPLIRSLIKQLKSFLERTGSAENLAIFRIIFFGFFALGLPFGYNHLFHRTMAFATMPESAIVPLPVFQPIMELIPLGSTMVNIIMPLFAISIVASLVGFKTRYSIGLFVLTSLVIFGIPDMFGKINHNHHIVWIGFILMLSPCGDAFSIDSRSIKHAASVKYGMPFAIIWLMMGVIYFFPGFWKIWTSGLDWIFTDNVRNQMYWKWFEMNDWEPFFRFDQHALIYRCGGLFTVIFELFFIFLVVSDRYRKWAVAGGLLFHLGTWLSLNIFFVVLVLTYASFINWDKLFKRAPIVDLTRPVKYPKLMRFGGLSLIMVLIVFGSLKILSWPFTVYPLFDQMVGTELKTLQFDSVRPNGETSVISKEALKTKFSSERYRSLENQIIAATENGSIQVKSELLRELTKAFSADTISVQVSILTTSAIPERSSQPTSKELIYTLDIPESNR